MIEVDVDIDKVTWRKVDIDEYNEAHFLTPHRQSVVGSQWRYELGTLPRKLPTKRGAILTPPKGWKGPDENWDTTIFVKTDNYWMWIDPDDEDTYVDHLAQEALDAGGIIQFEGVDD